MRGPPNNPRSLAQAPRGAGSAEAASCGPPRRRRPCRRGGLDLRIFMLHAFYTTAIALLPKSVGAFMVTAPFSDPEKGGGGDEVFHEQLTSPPDAERLFGPHPGKPDATPVRAREQTGGLPASMRQDVSITLATKASCLPPLRIGEGNI